MWLGCPTMSCCRVMPHRSETVKGGSKEEPRALMSQVAAQEVDVVQWFPVSEPPNSGP